MSPGFLPRRPAPAPRHSGAAMRATDENSTVTVGPEDSLWSIAAEYAGPDASDWEIARIWPRWFTANRQLIGDDPARLRPGTVLTIPPATR